MNIHQQRSLSSLVFLILNTRGIAESITVLLITNLKVISTSTRAPVVGRVCRTTYLLYVHLCVVE